MESTATARPTTKPMPPSASLDMIDGTPGDNGHGDMAVITLVHKDKLTWAGSVYREGESAMNNDVPGVFKFSKHIPASVPRWAYDKLIGREEDLFGTGMKVPLFCAGEPPPEMLDDLPESDQVSLLHDRVAALTASVEATVAAVERLAEDKAAEGTLSIEGAAPDPLAGINERIDGLEAQNERVARALETLAKQRAPAKPKKKRKARKKKTVKAKARVGLPNADVPSDTGSTSMPSQETAANAADSAE